MTPLNVTLADLIARLDGDLDEATDLARISEAHLRAQTLSDLGDQLVGHYVDKARQAGASWSEIGQAIGVSKQAAQQRHTPTPFDRYTDLNRHVVVLAQEAARAHRHDYIGTEHLLLGLLGEPTGTAYEVLLAKAGSEQHLRDAIEAVMPPAGRRMPRGHIAFHPQAKEAIDRAKRASAELGSDMVGTEHLLVGLIRVPASPAANVLRALGFTPDELLEAVRASATGSVTGPA